MSGITQKMLNEAAEAIRKKFLEYGQKQIDTWRRLGGNLPVAVKCTWKPSQAENQMHADISIGFKMDEVKDMESFTFVDGNGPIFDSSYRSGINSGGEAATVDGGGMRPGIDYDE